MRATGMVRRIDNLGRLVLPKEIRKTLRIREGDPLEIFTDKNGEIVLRKYSPISELSTLAQEYADAAIGSLNCIFCVSDRDQIVAAAGTDKKQIIGKGIKKDVEKLMDDRRGVYALKGEEGYVEVLESEENDYSSVAIQTIISEGDAIGAVILLGKNDKQPVGIEEYKNAMIAARFLGRQMEG